MTTLKNDIEKNEEFFQNYYQPSSLNCPNCPMYTCPYYTTPSFSNQAMRSEAQPLDELQASDPGFRQRRPFIRRRRRRRPFFRPFFGRPFFGRPFFPIFMNPHFHDDFDFEDDFEDDWDWY